MKKLAIVLFALAVMTGMGAAQTLKTSNVNVTVSSTTAIDIHPQKLYFNETTPGSQTTRDYDGFGSVVIQNVGSENVTQIWSSVDQPQNDPFATGDSSAYDAGNFIQIKPNSSDSSRLNGDENNYHFVSRVEYLENDTNEIPSYLDINGQINGSTVTAGDTFVGRFRVNTDEFFFVIPTGTSNLCDGSGGQASNVVLRVADVPHNTNQLGTYDFTDSGSQYTDYGLTSTSSGYGRNDASAVNISAPNGESRLYDVLTSCDGTERGDAHIIRTRYDVDEEGASLAGSSPQAQYLFDEDTTPSAQLAPGDDLTFDIAVEIPRGVAQGDVDNGVLTMKVNSN